MVAAVGDLHLAVQKGLDVDVDFKLKQGHPIMRWLSSHDKALTIDDLDEMLKHQALGEQEMGELERMRIEMFIPLRARGELIGCLGVGPKLSQHGYSQDDELTLTTLANQTAVAIDNARLYEAIQQELAERRRAEEALRTQRKAEHELSQRLAKLHEVSLELSLTDSLDDLCRLAIELGYDLLGFDRIGIWFVAPKDPTNKYKIYNTAKAMGTPVESCVHQSPNLIIKGFLAGGSSF